MTGSGKFVELQATAEQTPFEDGQMAELIALARAGIEQVKTLQDGVLAERP